MSADSKPTDYLLNYVDLVPGVLEVIYEMVALQGPLTLDQCRKLLWYRKEADSKVDHVLLALNFLEANDVVARNGYEYRATQGPLSPHGIRARVIRGLRAQTESQAHFMGIHDLLVTDGLSSIEVGALMGVLNEHKMVTTGAAAVNDIKLGFWMRLMDFLGVVHQATHAKSVSLTPDCGLMLYLASEAAADAREISLPAFLEGVEQDYFRVTTRQRELHPGVGAALLRLRDRGQIGLTTKSDAAAVKLSATVTASHITLKEGESDV